MLRRAGIDGKATLTRHQLVADLAYRALLDELATWPKPGLVSFVDSGSHQDMDAHSLAASAAAIAPYIAAMVRAGEDRADLSVLRLIGLAAEEAMLDATGGANSHRGAIFSLGLLAAAEGRDRGSRRSACDRAIAVAEYFGHAIRASPRSSSSHGERAVSIYRVGGAREEAAAGFPSVRMTGLPALAEGRRLRPGDENAAKVHCLFSLIATIDDTNLLHRGGMDGLAYARDATSAFLAEGGVGATGWEAHATDVHRGFVARRLSPGGSADLLAVTLMLDALEWRA